MNQPIGTTATVELLNAERWRELGRLIERGLITTQADYQGWTILHHAVWANAPVPITRAIIEKVGVPPNLGDHRGNTSMHDAAYMDVSIDLVRYLISAGGDPNQGNRFNETAVFEASYRGGPELMKVLLENGGNPNIRTIRGETPLFAAIQADADILVILYLLKWGATITPQDVAAAANHPESLRALHRTRVMLAIFCGRIPRLRGRNSLKVLPDELLRRVNDML